MPAKSFSDVDEFEAFVKEAKLPVIVDFFATWCGPCKMVSPKFDRLSEENKDKYVTVKVDLDENEEIAAEYEVQAVPTFLLFRDGKVEHRVVGADQQKLADLFTK